MKYIKKVAATPLEAIAKVIDSLTSQANERSNAPSIRAVRQGIENAWELIYPIGSIYMSTNATNPALLFGGTWDRISNKFLLASGTEYEPGSTGGAASVSYTPAGTVDNHTLTVEEMPTHRHNEDSRNLYMMTDSTLLDWSGGLVAKASMESVGNGRGIGRGDTDFKTQYEGGTNASFLPGETQPHNHGFTGSQASIDNMPPYLAVYIWERTA